VLSEHELSKSRLSRQDLIERLRIGKPRDLQRLLDRAYHIKEMYVGRTVYLRGIIEFSNVCLKNCYYCGIRSGNNAVRRFQMSLEEILEAARWAYDNRYGSIVLQAGERRDREFIRFVKKTVVAIGKMSRGELAVTLSLGEQAPDTFRSWHEAGAHRYLLRIETSNPKLYRSLHPEDHDHGSRLRCLDDLRSAGFQVGTGVMIGLPGQTMEDLVDDILFFKKQDVDMIGMGPFIPHRHTPLGTCFDGVSGWKERQLELGLKMIALTRMVLKDVNIASTTALQTLRFDGRELGLKAGANVIMPNITQVNYRSDYQLYDGKPCLDENAAACRDCLRTRIESLGEVIGYGQRGDSPHFQKKERMQSKQNND
jgi:biotin synthase